jgi:hypothetical protein
VGADNTGDAVALGIATFGVLGKMGLFGRSLIDLRLSDSATTFVATDDGRPIFARLSLQGDAAGYVDIALQPVLGDPVLAVVPGRPWDPTSFIRRAAAAGYEGKRWVSYATGDAALDCGAVLLDPLRSDAKTLYIVPAEDARKPWGLSAAQEAANLRRYAMIAQAIAAGAAPGPAATPQTLPLCLMSNVPAPGQQCIPQIQQQGGESFCAPASLEMGIEYCLGQNQPTKYQFWLAGPLGLLKGGSLQFQDVPKIPKAVSTATVGAVTCTIKPLDWSAVKGAIAASQPFAYINSNHTILVYGYSEASASPLQPAYIYCVDPAGASAVQKAFASQPKGYIATLALTTPQKEPKFWLRALVQALWNRIGLNRGARGRWRRA